jgi:antitoxin YefM
MDAKTYEDAAANLDALMDQAVDDAETIIITRAGKPPVVLMSLDEWNALNTTASLMRSPANRARLQEAFRQADAGLAVEHRLAGE